MGVWSIRKCRDKDCGTLWLDPTPKEPELQKLYTHYYTHAVNSDTSPKKNTSRKFLSLIRESYLSSEFNYKPPSNSLKDRLLSLIAYVHPAWKDTQAADLFYLPARPNGRLLDVGCGSGTTMQLMTQKGWVATGIDFDENAVQNARTKGLDARLGELSSQNFANETFDAVVMGHVIEHVPHPLELIKECRRVLKKGGVLVITTPNADSPCSRYYGRNWRGLETPRHLQVFTTKSLGKIAHYAGFSAVKSFTTMQSDLYIWRASRDLAKYNKHDMTTPVNFYTRIILHFLNFFIGWVNIFIPGNSEVAVIFCEK